MFELFLFPNNSDSGNLEILLEKIINPKHSAIFECFDGYQNCLKGKSKSYKVPASKTKIFAYLDTLLSSQDEKFAKEDKRDYRNTNHWDLDNSYLNILKEFLEKY